MQTEFRIKRFKRINDEIVLKDFDRVNYFVGKNASGKTSVLNALSFLNDGTNSRHFFNKDSIVELFINGKKQFLLWEDVQKNPNNASHQGNLNLQIILTEHPIGEKGANGVRTLPILKYDNVGKEQLEFLNQTLSLLQIKPVVAERIINNEDPWDNSVGTRIFKQEQAILNLQFLSDGVKSLNSIRHWLTKSISNLQDAERRSCDAIFIILEELENNLHPELQKKIPLLLNDFVNSQELYIKEKLFVYVSTHSPFIIGSCSNFSNQKVYLFNEGMLSDLSQSAITSSDGFKGGECAWVVSQMLGSDVTDLGYPENYCILEEYSLQVILEHCKRIGLIKNIQFVSASGAMRIISLTETINELENLNTLLKCNPYYFDKYLLIIDSLKDFQPSEIMRIESIRKKLKNRFTELKETSLENYYVNLDKARFESAIEEIAKQKGRYKGVAKGKWANAIAGLIKNKSDFSNLFGNELDFLLR